MKAVIIGGGLGGLATALRLRVKGWHVTVFEAGPTFGGKLNCWKQRGYVFDTGPSLLTLPHVFEELYACLGERLEDHLSLLRIDPHAEYRFSDGVRIVCPDNIECWRDTVRRIEPRDLRGFDRFLTLGRDIYELSDRTFFRRGVFSRPSIGELSALRYLPFRRGWGNYAATVEALFRSPHLRRIYNRYPTYVGSSPYLCPATLLIIPYIEHRFGAWYVKGGLYKVVESLVELAARRGIDLAPNSRVVSILRHGDRVEGLRLEDGSTARADVVVMNGDATAVSGLLGEPRPVDSESRSLSGFVSLRGTPVRPNDLLHHTVVFSDDYPTEFDDLFKRKTFPVDPTVYISAPAINDPSLAPAGGDSLFIMANAPATNSPWTEQETSEASRRIERRISAAGIDLGAAEVSDVWHPGRFARDYLAPGGAIYGDNSHGWKNAFLRPPNRSPGVRGLYFVGGSSHPGGGTPTVLMSARITSEAISRDASR